MSEVADGPLEQLAATILICFFLSEKNLPVVSLEDLGDEGMSVSDIDQFSDEDNQVKPNLQYCTLIVIILTIHCIALYVVLFQHFNHIVLLYIVVPSFQHYA